MIFFNIFELILKIVILVSSLIKVTLKLNKLNSFLVFKIIKTNQ